MQEVTVYTVDNEEYEFRHMDPVKASRLLVRVVKPLLKPLGAALSGAKDMAGALDANLDMAGAFGALADTLNEDEFDRLLKELLAVVRLKTGMELIPSLHFEGRVFHMHKVAFKSFEHNFHDFLAEMSGAVGFLRRTMTQGQPASTGSSGASSSPALPRSLKSSGAGQ